MLMKGAIPALWVEEKDTGLPAYLLMERRHRKIQLWSPFQGSQVWDQIVQLVGKWVSNLSWAIFLHMYLTQQLHK